jgi:hypothetical protein
VTKIVTSGPGLLHFSGIEPARFIVPVEMGDLPVLRLLRNPACTLAGKRFARIELLYFKRFVPGLRLGCVWVAFLLAISVGELRF